jgi:hypothetical protein
VQGADGLPPRYAPINLVPTVTVGLQIASAVNAALYFREKYGSRAAHRHPDARAHAASLVMGEHLAGAGARAARRRAGVRAHPRSGPPAVPHQRRPRLHR